MYLYIYDSFLSDKKYTDLLSQIEKRVTDLGIKGRIARLSILKNMKELITDGIKSGVQTVVVIGNVQTFAKVINIVAGLDVVLGLIPVENDNKIAKMLGVPPKVLACDILASRIIKKIDLGLINNHYFMGQAELNNASVLIEYDGYSVRPTTVNNNITIYNFADRSVAPNSSPVDGVLELVITPIKSGVFGKKNVVGTVLPFSKIKISTEGEDQVSILTDEQVIMKTPAEVSVAPQKLRVIVGPERCFE
ncbi:MAG: DAGKc protein [Patescibacteria group bacterium]|nr:DAGKc protein [Patescibacteria group bacterium]MDQ5970490.1 DAGKc protein [Patescibacteria group bacterium]